MGTSTLFSILIVKKEFQLGDVGNVKGDVQFLLRLMEITLYDKFMSTIMMFYENIMFLNMF